MVYDIKLHSFEGPLDLLLHLIDRAEVDIYDIPIAEITDQYLQYLYVMQQLQLDLASEFIVMASTLLSIKSQMLLPKREETELELLGMEEEEIDPREELVQRLLEYKKYKEMAGHLREKEADRSQVFTRPAEDLTPYLKEEENPVSDVSLYDLMDALQKVWLRTEEETSMAKIERDEISVQDRMSEIVTLLHGGGGVLRFTQIFINPASRSEVVTSFMALLELMKKKQIVCEQSKLFEDILIKLQHTEQQGGG